MTLTTLMAIAAGLALSGATDWETLTRQGIALHQQGRYADAERTFQQAWSIAEQFAPEDARRWRSLHNVAALAYVRGEYGRARQLFAKLLQADAPSELERGKVLSTMATLLRTQGDLEQAEASAREAVTILRSAGPQSKALANTYHVLAEIQRHRRAFPESMRLLDEAAQILAALAEPDPLEGLTLQSRASLYSDQGRSADAEQPQRRAVAIFESLCGPRHPLTVSAISNLGQILSALGKRAEAQPLMERALEVWEAELGPSHPNVAAAANNLAQLYRATGRTVDADPLYRKAITIWEQALGADHPDTAKGWKNLGDLYRQQGKFRGAEALYQRALRIFEKAYGRRHPATEEVLVSLRQTYEASGRRVEARRAALALAAK